MTTSCSITKISLALISLLITITILISILNLFLTFFSNPNPPVIRLNSFTIPHLEFIKADIAGIWLGNLTIYNPNPTFELYMSHIQSSIYYRQENAVSLTWIDDLNLGLNEDKHVYVKFAVTGKKGDREQPILEYPVVREFERDVKEKKKIEISMRMRMMGVFRSGWRLRHDIIDVFCMDLVVLFVGENGESRGGGARDGDCLVQIEELK